MQCYLISLNPGCHFLGSVVWVIVLLKTNRRPSPNSLSMSSHYFQNIYIIIKLHIPFNCFQIFRTVIDQQPCLIIVLQCSSAGKPFFPRQIFLRHCVRKFLSLFHHLMILDHRSSFLCPWEI